MAKFSSTYLPYDNPWQNIQAFWHITFPCRECSYVFRPFLTLWPSWKKFNSHWTCSSLFMSWKSRLACKISGNFNTVLTQLTLQHRTVFNSCWILLSETLPSFLLVDFVAHFLTSWASSLCSTGLSSTYSCLKEQRHARRATVSFFVNQIPEAEQHSLDSSS